MKEIKNLNDIRNVIDEIDHIELTSINKHQILGKGFNLNFRIYADEYHLITNQFEYFTEFEEFLSKLKEVNYYNSQLVKSTDRKENDINLLDLSEIEREFNVSIFHKEGKNYSIVNFLGNVVGRLYWGNGFVEKVDNQSSTHIKYFDLDSLKKAFKQYQTIHKWDVKNQFVIYVEMLYRLFPYNIKHDSDILNEIDQGALQSEYEMTIDVLDYKLEKIYDLKIVANQNEIYFDFGETVFDSIDQTINFLKSLYV